MLHDSSAAQAYSVTTTFTLEQGFLWQPIMLSEPAFGATNTCPYPKRNKVFFAELFRREKLSEGL
jgi:hypothetical protein